MKLLVFSDSHRRNADMLDIIGKETPDVVLHLGDMVSDAEDIAAVYPRQQLFYVAGNNDWNAAAEDNLIVQAEDMRLFLTHGHLYSVRRNTERLAGQARRNGCKIALYGHTHRADLHWEDGVLVANPGSIGMPYAAPPSYLRLLIVGGEAEPELVYLDAAAAGIRKKGRFRL